MAEEKTDILNESSINTTIKSEVINTKKEKKEILTKVKYCDNECNVIKQNKDEVLLEIQTENYLTGKLIKVKQWVKLEAVQKVE